NPGVFSIGQDSNAVGEVNMIEGRVLNGGGETRVGAWGTGTLNMQMNARFEAGDLIVGQDSGSSGTLNLQQGSTLVVDSLRTHASSTSQINLDSGSTIAIQSGTQDLFENFKQGEIDITNGAVLDTSTHDVSTASNFGGFSGTGVLSKEGNGSLTLHGESTHLGTLVDAGSLIVEGEVTGFVTVSAGATVGGSGVTGDMTLTDAHLAPGSSPGEITVASLSFNGDNTIAFELGIGAAQSDLISVLGAIESDGGEILFNFLDNGWVDDQTYDLINFGSSTIDLADYAYSSGDSDFGGTFSQSGNTLQFTTQFIPEPSSTLLLALAGGSLLTRRRPLSPRQKTCVPHKRHQPPLRAGVPLFPKS
ncbi:MAG: PEP-CTERM sorting domain-containing protein, partial [Verrucomicrobiales bacterium]